MVFQIVQFVLIFNINLNIYKFLIHYLLYLLSFL